jgi:hypothetical protein
MTTVVFGLKSVKLEWLSVLKNVQVQVTQSALQSANTCINRALGGHVNEGLGRAPHVRLPNRLETRGLRPETGLRLFVHDGCGALITAQAVQRSSVRLDQMTYPCYTRGRFATHTLLCQNVAGLCHTR